ncbi:serine/threonine-protein phosphatase 6 regulatory ankyrin repeat subunit C-like [Pomacea canaliculata]|uniref:serine/threonine-protein phosphatase 6 regulatory ankyrin repeat subunit C-like n=1 Tax=Pomacea canaliculata TaxID=400727 RepID=UPI000D72C840|nr:serine/threonine-protein phosphatase 6 regulatory ankyrin repeat subunit C-like [Pomacea canaliculata]XP_025088751.1 serine/threonine-protein phosphatase 6 regulatory ankyrin repeat subunit C-like [Pomacea canaliculata]XP_025088752.1 serine/threonine-protein phosphatase 6 regulatory ankyrin repeat subunit C-like [Pomacea canaliculata]XP_025088753.1 serine/threonine-protein phosphatase 6 regulatory ankyrin repeat subunit C-like [Pomacea canaliculata]XP_025088754.1 serine/threonine-protein pho
MGQMLSAWVNADLWQTMPLELAIRKEQKKVTEIPVSNGARPNQSSSQNSLLHAACDLGNLQVVNILLKHGANPCALNSNGNTPLWLAVCQGHLEVVKILLQYYIKSSSCSEQSIDSPSALYAAAYYNHMAIAELLIKAGADVNKRNSKGKTALHAACTNENFPLVNLLLEKGALVNAGSVFIATPIHEAVLKGNPEIVQRLIAAGADVNMVCREQDILGLEGSPLHVAVSGGNKEMISVLCSGQGVDVNVRNFHGQTPLVVAIVSGFVSCVHELLENGADVNRPSSSGLLPLALAVCFEKDDRTSGRRRNVFQKPCRARTGYSNHCSHADLRSDFSAAKELPRAIGGVPQGLHFQGRRRSWAFEHVRNTRFFRRQEVHLFYSPSHANSCGRVPAGQGRVQALSAGLRCADGESGGCVSADVPRGNAGHAFAALASQRFLS